MLFSSKQGEVEILSFTIGGLSYQLAIISQWLTQVWQNKNLEVNELSSTLNSL
jgi:hypothetical protein